MTVLAIVAVVVVTIVVLTLFTVFVVVLGTAVAALLRVTFGLLLRLVPRRRRHRARRKWK